MLNEGTYRARLLRLPMSDHTSKETPFVAMLFEVTMGPHLGERVWGRWHITEASAHWAVKALRAVGWTGRSFADLASGITRKTVDVQIDVRHDQGRGQNEGKRYPRVAFVNKLAELRVTKPIGDLEAELLSQRFAAFLLQSQDVVDGTAGDDSPPDYDEQTGEDRSYRPEQGAGAN